MEKVYPVVMAIKHMANDTPVSKERLIAANTIGRSRVKQTVLKYGFTNAISNFVDMFRIVKGGIEELSDDLKNKAAGIRTFPTGFEALMKTEDINGFSNLTIEPATIDEIVVFTSKKGDDYE